MPCDRPAPAESHFATTLSVLSGICGWKEWTERETDREKVIAGEAAIISCVAAGGKAPDKYAGASALILSWPLWALVRLQLEVVRAKKEHKRGGHAEATLWCQKTELLNSDAGKPVEGNWSAITPLRPVCKVESWFEFFYFGKNLKCQKMQWC